MYVCICNAFTDSQVKTLLETKGARRPADVYRGMGCKPQCGKCSVEIKEMIDEHRAPKNPVSPARAPANPAAPAPPPPRRG